MNPKDMPGRTIVNRYKILEKIGGGGMSVVWKGYDLVLDRYVALKILRPEMSEDEEFVRRFRREAKAAAALSHPNIVAIYDVGEDQGLYFIVMELVEGETLRDRLRQKGKLEVKEALRIAAQVADGLAHAHANKLIHRDIKPQNILITRQGRIKVADFGIARALGGASTTSTNVVVGSAPYLSPEQARNGLVSVRSDLYSLGVVLYEMLSGKPPFIGDNPLAVALQHVEAKAPPLKSDGQKIPQDVQNLVEKALSKNPLERFGSAEEMARAIRACLDNDFERGGEEEVQGRNPVSDGSKGDESIAKGKKKRRSLSPSVKVFLAFLILALGLLAYAVYVFNKWMAVPIVVVPDTLGKSQLEAQSMIRAQGLIPQLSAEKYDENFPAGVVISQSPVAGEKVKKGREVYYVISKGQEFLKVPDVLGKTTREAQLDLENVGLVLGNIEYEFSASVPKDKIIGQNPRQGTEVASGTRVDVTVSKGPMPETTVVPAVVGLTRENAQDKLKEALLEVGQVNQIPGDKPYGEVLAQDPPSGQEVPIRTKVTLTISLGKEKPSNTYKTYIVVPQDPGAPNRLVNVKVLVSDSTQKDRVVYDRNENQGANISIEFSYKGREAIMKVFFDGKLVSERTIRP